MMIILTDYLPVLMFVALVLLLFTGYPVGAVLGGIGIGFGFIGISLGVFSEIEFFNIVARIWGGIANNLILVAVPMFIFMGTMFERSGIATDLLKCMQVLLRQVPGGLALSVTCMGVIMAAMTGIVGASVVMMTIMALPVMLERHYNTSLATGTIAASGTLGILIPPIIMLVIMADLLGRSVGNLFVAALFPGLVLAALYLAYILLFCSWKPHLAPALPGDAGPLSSGELWHLVLKGVVPPILLIFLVLGSIVFGWTTPTEAAGVGAFGAILLALVNGRLNLTTLKDVVDRSARTGTMIFFIFVGATAFSYTFRSLGGDDIVIGMVDGAGLTPWEILVMLMAIVFFLGFFFDWIEITLIVLPVFTPMIELLDFGDHVAQSDLVYWFAVLIAVNLQTSFLTPPFGAALFYLKGVAPPGVRIQQIYIGITPFVVLQLIGLGLVMIFPEIAMWLPRQLLN
jgi:tripartite ATP-independent transporter DctM subunit